MQPYLMVWLLKVKLAMGIEKFFNWLTMNVCIEAIYDSFCHSLQDFFVIPSQWNVEISFKKINVSMIGTLRS